jgi:hypothetical protein
MYSEKQEDKFYRAVTCLLLGIDYLPDLKNVRSTDRRKYNQRLSQKLDSSTLRRFNGAKREDIDTQNKYSLYGKINNVNNPDFHNLSKRRDLSFPREPRNSFYDEHFFK